MNFFSGFKLSALAGIICIVAFFSCEDEITTIGEGIVGDIPFISDSEVYDVTAVNIKLDAVQTNGLPLYQLGVYEDAIYGTTQATITSQLGLSVVNPTFGIYSQEAENDNSLDTTIPENETVTEVYLYIPYLNNQTDSDGDGVIDDLEDGDDILDPTNDSDGDGIANNVEVANTTNPLNEDTDGDGINDADDEETLGGRFAQRFRLDSIYGDREAAFNLKVERSTFFLRDLDPDSNFENAQEYFSSQEFSPAFVDETLFDDSVLISDEQILFEVLVDDPDTDDNEIGTISRTRDPGIRVPLDIDFFQENIIDNEGGSQLLSSTNFQNFLRGLHLSLRPTTDELLILLDIANADIEITYEYDLINSEEKEEDIYTINLLSTNAVNTFINDEYPTDILSEFNEDVNPSRLYLKGGAGSYTEIELFNDGDIAAIQANNWIINEANLVFHLAREGLVDENEEPPRLYLFNTETNAPLYNLLNDFSDDFSPLGVFPGYDALFDDSDPSDLKYTVRITDHINNIISRDSTNVKIGVMVSPDITEVRFGNTMVSEGVESELPLAPILTPLSTVLYGSDSETVSEDKRLQLEIFFTEID